MFKKRYVSIVENTKLSSNVLKKYIAAIAIIFYIILSVSMWVYMGAEVRSLNLSNK